MTGRLDGPNFGSPIRSVYFLMFVLNERFKATVDLYEGFFGAKMDPPGFISRLV